MTGHLDYLHKKYKINAEIATLNWEGDPATSHKKAAQVIGKLARSYDPNARISSSGYDGGGQQADFIYDVEITFRIFLKEDDKKALKDKIRAYLKSAGLKDSPRFETEGKGLIITFTSNVS